MTFDSIETVLYSLLSMLIMAFSQICSGMEHRKVSYFDMYIVYEKIVIPGTHF